MPAVIAVRNLGWRHPSCAIISQLLDMITVAQKAPLTPYLSE